MMELTIDNEVKVMMHGVPMYPQNVTMSSRSEGAGVGMHKVDVSFTINVFEHDRERMLKNIIAAANPPKEGERNVTLSL
jgi:hypothetical protein